MNILNWFKSIFSRRELALARYRSGMAKAKKENYSGAIEDYTASIRAPGIPIDVKAMALYNRALAYSAMHDTDNANKDLAEVLKIPGLPENIRTAAGQRQERLRRRSSSGTSP